MSIEENIKPSQKKELEEITLNELIIKLKSFLNYLDSKKVYFIIALIVGGIMGFLYFRNQTPNYTANCIFILEEKSGGGGGLSGLASQFGLDFGTGGGGGSSIFSGDNLLEIIPSRNIVQKVLLSKVDSLTDLTMADLFLDFTKLKKNWAGNNRLAGITFEKINTPLQLNLIQDSIINVIYKQITSNFLVVDWLRKKTALIKVSVTSKNEKFSKLFTERLVNESKLFYINLKTNAMKENEIRLQNKADSLFFLLNHKSYLNAELQVLNANPAIKTALVPTEIAARDKTILTSVYGEIVKNLETTKIILSQQTPVIQILDEPQFPLDQIKVGFLKSIVIGMVSFFFFIFLWFTIRFVFKNK